MRRTLCPSSVAQAAMVLIRCRQQSRYKPMLRACVSANSCVSRSVIEARRCAATLLPLAAQPSCMQELNALWAAWQCRLLHGKPPLRQGRLKGGFNTSQAFTHSPLSCLPFQPVKAAPVICSTQRLWPDICEPRPGLAAAAASSLHKLFTHSAAGTSYDSLVGNSRARASGNTAAF
jgi:hypothetical protein